MVIISKIVILAGKQNDCVKVEEYLFELAAVLGIQIAVSFQVKMRQ